MAKHLNRPGLLERAIRQKKVEEPVAQTIAESAPDEIIFEKGEFAEALSARKLFRALGINDTNQAAVRGLKFQEIEEAYYLLTQTSQSREWLKQSFIELQWYNPKISKFLPGLIDHISRHGKSVIKPARYALEELDSEERFETYRQAWTKLYQSDAAKMAQSHAEETAKRLEQKTDKVLNGLRKAIHAYNVRNKDVPKDTPVELREPFILSTLGITPYHPDHGYLMGLDLSGFRFPPGSDFSTMNLRGTKLLVPPGAKMNGALFGRDEVRGILNNTRFIRNSDIHSLRSLFGTLEFASTHIDGLSNAKGYVAIFGNSEALPAPLLPRTIEKVPVEVPPPSLEKTRTNRAERQAIKGARLVASVPVEAAPPVVKKLKSAVVAFDPANYIVNPKLLENNYVFSKLGISTNLTGREIVRHTTYADVQALQAKLEHSETWRSNPLPGDSRLEQALRKHVEVGGEQVLEEAKGVLSKFKKERFFEAYQLKWLDLNQPPKEKKRSAFITETSSAAAETKETSDIDSTRPKPDKDRLTPSAGKPFVSPQESWRYKVGATVHASALSRSKLTEADFDDIFGDLNGSIESKSSEANEESVHPTTPTHDENSLPTISRGILLEVLKSELRSSDKGFAHRVRSLAGEHVPPLIEMVREQYSTNPDFATALEEIIAAGKKKPGRKSKSTATGEDHQR